MNKLSDIALEQKVLATLIVYPKTYEKYANKLYVPLFTEKIHQKILQIIIQFSKENKPFDLVVLSLECDRQKIDSSYLMAISTFATTSATLEVYIMYLVELTIKRDFLQKFTNLISLAESNETDIFELRDECFNSLDDLFIHQFVESNKQSQPFPKLIEKVQERFMNIVEGNEITGIPSSLQIINKVFGGWQNTDLTIVAARPAMGKTSFMVQQIVDAASQGKSVGVFSLEMSSEQITSKILTNFTQIPNSSVLRKGLSQNEIKAYFRMKEDLVRLPIHIDDTPGISIQNLKIKAKMMKMRFKIDILLVDYLQLITFEKAYNREQEISTISRGLKAVAKELEIPVIALSQLSRKVEQRPDKRPLLSDLRDSGAIEQDADEVVFLYRPEYYGIESWLDYNNVSTINEAEIIIQKNRHGGILSERVKVDMPTSRFMNLKN